MLGGCGEWPEYINDTWHVLCTCGALMVPVLLPYPEYLRECDIPNCASCAGDRFGGKMGAFYSCTRDGCDGIHSANRIGLHRVGKPMGTTGSMACQKLRHYVHIEFDHLWMHLKNTRAWGYRLLSKLMDLDVRDTHMAMFDIHQCKLAIRMLRQWKKTHKIPMALPSDISLS